MFRVYLIHSFMVSLTEAGMLNVLCRPGLIMQHKDESAEPFLVLASNSWATLTWPLIMVEEFGDVEKQFVLNMEAQVEWLYCYNPEDYLVLPYNVIWGDHGLTAKTFASPQPLLHYVLLNLQGSFTLNNLHSVAHILGIVESSKRPTKKNTLQALAEYIGNGDENFVEEVLFRAESGSKKATLDANEEMVQCFLNELDQSEKVDFNDLGKSAKEKAMTRQKEKWRQWHKEAVQEKKD